MIKKALITFLVFNLVGCNSTPTVTNSWLNQNCKSLDVFTPDKTPKRSYCKSFDGISQTCKRKNYTYQGTYLDGKRHGNGETTIVNTTYTYLFKGIYKQGKQWCGISQLENGYNQWVNGNSSYHDQQIDWEKIAIAIGEAAQNSAESIEERRKERELQDKIDRAIANERARCTWVVC